MKLGTVVLENFGCYRHKSLEFQHAPLVLVYGPNESGKTTTLNGIRQALFGFPVRSSYLQSSGKMKATVQLLMRNGNLLEYSRQKGRSDSIEAQLNGQAIAEERLREILCNLDLDAYAKLFGFSLDELRQGEAALRTARLDEALTGGGLGGIAALQDLQNELQDSLTAMYKLRGSTSTINQKLTEIKSTQEQLRRHEVLPTAVQDLREQLLETRHRCDSDSTEYKSVFTELNQRQRLLDALPIYREYRQLTSLLAQIEVPSNADAQFSAELRECLQRQESLAKQIESETDRIRGEQQDMLGLGALELSEQQTTQIEVLGHQADGITQKRAATAKLREQLAATEDACRKHLESLGLEELNSDVRSFSVADPEREQLELLSTEFGTIREELLTAESRLETLRETMLAEADDAAAEYLGPSTEQLRELQRLVAESEESEKVLASAESVYGKLQNAPELLVHAREASHALQPGVDLATGFVVPTDLQIQQASEALTKSEQQLERIRSTCQDALQNLEQHQEKLSKLDQSRVAEPLRQLQEMLARRDEIIQQWLDDLGEPLIAASLDGSEQSARLRDLQRVLSAADEQQAAILDAADQMAAVHHLQKQVAQAQTELGELQMRRDQAKIENDDALKAWRDLWSNCPVIETSQDNLRHWRKNYLEWQSLQVNLAEAKRELESLRLASDQARQRVKNTWPTDLTDGVPVTELKTRIKEWETAERDFQREQQRLREAKQRRDKSLQQQEQLSGKLEALKGRQRLVLERYGKWLNDAPVNSDWPISRVATLLENLDRLRREDQAAVRLQEQVAAAEAELQQYDNAAKKLISELESVSVKQLVKDGVSESFAVSPDSARGSTVSAQRADVGLASEHMAKHWLERLQKLREQDAKRIHLAAALEHRTENVRRWEKESQGVDKRVKQLCAKVDRSDTVGIQELLDRVEQAEQCRRRLAEVRASLQALTRADEFQDFLKVLAEADPAQLELEISEREVQLKRLEESRKSAEQQIGSLSNQIELLANNAAVLKYQQALQNQRGELAELSEQWIVDRFAKLLLEKSIDRFASDHEPVLLKHTKHYLAKLTGGRYVDIGQESGSATDFFVRDAQNAAVSPDRLSTGTREQLYLAIRMAFITYHAEMQEPLPVIMDDCFVNFDDERTRNALLVLRDWSPNIQTIVLSCHRRFLDMMADIAPDAHVIHLADEAAVASR